MIKEKKLLVIINIILGLSILSIAGISFYQTIKEHEKIEEEIASEYSVLLTRHSIDSVVLSTYYPVKWRGGKNIQNVKFKNGLNFTIQIKRNLEPGNIYFGDIIKQGAHLRKKAGSDTITVISKGKEYRYMIYGF